MQLRLDAANLAFRAEIQAFLEAHLTDDVRRRSRLGMHPPSDDDRRWWNRVLHDKGWSAPQWPREYGGPGWSPLQVHLFEYECRLAAAPELRWQGLRLLGPVIYTFASDAQKARFLPGILSGDTMWGQGFSEPGAGSDLASLRTTAVRDGSSFVVNGQKIWTTEADESEWGFFLVRTDEAVKPHRGISMLVLDLKSPGVTVRGIPTINGESSTCEVFLENVRVPEDQLIGEPGSGWAQAKFLLSNERTASADIEKTWSDLRRVRRLASDARLGPRRLDDPLFAARLHELELNAEALHWCVLRVLCDAPSSYPVAARASMLKVRGSELQQEIAALAANALGPRGVRSFSRDEAFAAKVCDDVNWPDEVMGISNELLYLRALTIYGGAREVQKNIIAKAVFGF